MNPYTIGRCFVAGKKKYTTGSPSVGLGYGDVNQVPAWPYNQNLFHPYALPCGCKQNCPQRWTPCPYGPYSTQCNLTPPV